MALQAKMPRTLLSHQRSQGNHRQSRTGKLRRYRRVFQAVLEMSVRLLHTHARLLSDENRRLQGHRSDGEGPHRQQRETVRGRQTVAEKYGT